MACGGRLKPTSSLATDRGKIRHRVLLGLQQRLAVELGILQNFTRCVNVPKVPHVRPARQLARPRTISDDEVNLSPVFAQRRERGCDRAGNDWLAFPVR